MLGLTAELRDYSQSDRSACIALFDSNVPDFFAAHERADFVDFIDNLRGPYYVLCAAGEVIACGGIGAECDDSSVAVLCWGMVRSDLHRMGLGEQLLRARLAKIVEAKRFNAVIIETTQMSRAFFERFGFSAGEVTKNGFGTGYDLVPMKLDLGRA